jgi:hypothetical protein
LFPVEYEEIEEFLKDIPEPTPKVTIINKEVIHKLDARTINNNIGRS